MTYKTANQKPAWMKHIDRRVDVSDIWMEHTDPENERGEICEALFTSASVPCYAAREGCFDMPGFELVGIAVRDEGGAIYRDREWAMKMLGADAVWRIEAGEMEAV
jgi:hypothetical protein